MVQYGDVRQAVPQAKGRDLPTGTLLKILRNYGLRPRDLE
jgi:predicted RNA binding protein YcfA (HicA-like mRNA interferase family)